MENNTNTFCQPIFLFLSSFALLQNLVISLLFPFDIGHMKAVLHNLDLLGVQYAAFSNCFRKYLLKYHPQLILFVFLSKQEPKL